MTSLIPGFTIVELKDAPVYRPRYAVLRDKTVEEVLAFSAEHPQVFVFPFATKLIDYRSLFREDDPTRAYIVQPFYIGGLEPAEADDMIRRIVAQALDTPISNWEEIAQ